MDGAYDVQRAWMVPTMCRALVAYLQTSPSKKQY